MSKARLVITAVIVEGRTVSEAARSYGVSRSWAYELVARYRTEGDRALDPRSRRPKHSPRKLSDDTVELILTQRQELLAQGLDAGAHTIAWHLEHHHALKVSPATIWRRLRDAGLIEDQPKKRPKSSYIRFQADQPNETWQSDMTHWHFADGTDVEILTFLDDHARYALSVTAHARVTTPIVVTQFTRTAEIHGIPASMLTDNGLIFTTRFAGPGGGRNRFETLLADLGVAQKNSRPNHPTTCGKVERFQQTLKRHLASLEPAATTTELQHQLDAFVDLYNTTRPHRSLDRVTPAVAYQRLPKAHPGHITRDARQRIRRDRIDNSGVVTLRYNGRLHHIGVGRAHARTHVLLLVDDRDIRIINAATGELLRTLTLDPTRDYQPIGTPKTKKPGP
jgi:transposase InsO family protein